MVCLVTRFLQHRIITAHAGDVEQAFRQGCEVVDQIYKIEIPRRADLVIASPGGHPRDIDLYQSQKTIHQAARNVLKGGNVLILANTTLEVAEACSGIRSLISLLTLGIVYGYFIDRRTIVRVVLAASTIPIAIVTNGGRVAGTGIAAHYFGPEAAQGFFHEFSGWLVFLVAFALLLLVQRLIVLVFPARTETAAVQAAAA